MGRPGQNLVGRRFERLLVLHRILSPRQLRHEPVWRVRCDCGNEKQLTSGNLVSGRTRSCGCLQKELLPSQLVHGYARKGQVTRTWWAWQRMKTRCCNPNTLDWDNYGGRGIRVCNGWRDDFKAFLADMGEVPQNKSLDRIKNNKGYLCGHCDECQTNGDSPNCRWATRIEQGRNKRNNRYATINGETRLIKEWAEHFGVPYQRAMNRIYRGSVAFLELG